MQILKPAVAGTLESSDLMVTLEPGTDGIELSLTSSVMNQYGRQIKKTVLETLERRNRPLISNQTAAGAGKEDAVSRPSFWLVL